jgi:hypothetical protein
MEPEKVRPWILFVVAMKGPLEQELEVSFIIQRKSTGT